VRSLTADSLAGQYNDNSGIDQNKGHFRQQPQRVIFLEKAQDFYCQHIHPEFESMGKLWYRSKLMQFLLKPTKMMQNHIQILTNRLNLRAVKTRTEGKDDDEDNDNNDYDDGDDDDDHDREDTNDEEEDVSAFGVSYIGVHIRRGDNYENPNHPFKKYSRGVKLLQKEYPKIQKVFLASDDQNAVEDGRERGWKALVNERRYRGEVKGKHGLASDGLRFYDLPSGFAESWDFFPMVFDLMLLAQVI